MTPHPDLLMAIARDRQESLQAGAARAARARKRRAAEPPDTRSLADVTIRLLRPSDVPALARLAMLDGARISGAPTLVAEVDGELAAARPLSGDRTIADPFRRTDELVALLNVRARQLRAAM